MFKHRVKIVISNIGMFFVAILLLALWVGFIFLLDKFFHISNFMEWLSNQKVGFAYFMLAVIGMGILYHIWKFINWLFIEPFKKEKI